MNKNVKLIIAIILIIIIIAVGIIVTKSIIDKNKINTRIKETEQKLSQINANELETKIIKALEDSSVNVEYFSAGESITTTFVKGEHEDSIENYVTAVMVEVNSAKKVVAIPCFKIESDNSGNFKNIQYLNNSGRNVEEVVSEIVENVFKNEYNIDITIQDDNQYNHKFNSYDGETLYIYRSNSALLNRILTKIKDDMWREEDLETQMKIFGLNIEK